MRVPPVLPRRTAMLLAAAAGLPRVAVAQADTRPSITVAVQTIATSGTLEPMREQSNVGQRIIAGFAEGMIEIDWLDTLKQRAVLADSWRRIDDRTLELTLRKGVKFHDGSVMTAEDVAFSFSAARMDGTEADQRGLWVGTAQNAADKRPPPEARAISKAAFPGFERIEIVGEHVVRFVNRTPDVTLEARLTRNTGTIFSRRGFEAASSWLEWARAPVGSGPYRIVRFRPNQDLLLESHDEHWSGRPPLKSLRFVEVPDVSARVNGLRAGDYDFACDIPPDQIEGIERDPRLHVLGGRIANHRLTIFDKTHPVLADPRVRRTMTLAVDRQAIVDSLWAGRTRIPKGLQHEFYGDMFIDDWEAPRYDPIEAKRLLKEAGYKGDAIPYQLLNNYYTNQTPSAQILVEGWRGVGLNVQIEMRENWGQILGRFPGRGICDNSNSAWFGDPVASMSAYAPGGQTWEAGQWQNPEAARAMETMQVSTDRLVRKAAFRRMLEICEREDPCYSILHQNATFTAKRKELPWRAAQSFVMDFSRRNWGA